MSSKRNLRRKACGTKQRYPTPEAARYAAHLLNKRDGAAMTCYRCQFCGGYHVGHMTARAQAAKAAAMARKKP